MREIDFTFQGMIPIILMRREGKSRMQYLTLAPLNGENKLWKKQMRPTHAAMTGCWEQQGDSDSEQVFQQVVQYHLTLNT